MTPVRPDRHPRLGPGRWNRAWPAHPSTGVALTFHVLNGSDVTLDPELRSKIERINAEQTGSESDPFTPFRYEQMARRLRGRAASVLDVGCNTGRGGIVLRRVLPEAELHGIDLIAERVAAIPSGVYASTTAGDLAVLADRGLQFDALVLAELLEHVPMEGIPTFLHHARSLLRVGGTLLLTTPNPHYLLIGRRSHGSVLGGAHVSVHCPVALAQFLEFAGFSVTWVGGGGRVARRLGSRLPLFLYGSFLLEATRAT